MMVGAKEGNSSFLKKRTKKLSIFLSKNGQLHCIKTLKPQLGICLGAGLAVWHAAQASSWGLGRLMAERAQLGSASARFTERKTMQALNAPIIVSGVLAYIAPDQLRKTTLSPRREQFVLDHDDVYMTGGTGNQTQRFSLGAAPQLAGLVEGIRATLAGDLPTLERFYEVQLAGPESGWRLNLRPRNVAAARFVTSIDIVGSGDRINEIDTKSPNGDHSEMTISEDVRHAK